MKWISWACWVLLFPSTLVGGTITSEQDGKWDRAETWEGGVVPSGDDVLVKHRVDYEGEPAAVGKVLIAEGGELRLADGSYFELHDGSLVVLGTLRQGDSEIHFDVTSDAGFRGGDGPGMPDTDFGLFNRGTWLCTATQVTPFARVAPQGEPSVVQTDRHGGDVSDLGVKERRSISEGSAVLLDAVTGWRAGDDVLLADTDGRSSLTRLQSVAGNRITFADAEFEAHTVERGDRVAYAYVVNLSRRAKVTAKGHGRRAHTMVMVDSKMTQVENVEFRELGPPGILGRYPFHLHKLGDAAGRVAPLKNLSVWNRSAPGQRVLAIHRTSHVTVEGIAAYNIKGHGVFLEDVVGEFGNTIRGGFVSTMTEPLPHEKLKVFRDDRNLRDTSVRSHHYWLNSGSRSEPNVFEDLVAHGPGVSVNLLQSNPRVPHDGPSINPGLATRVTSLGCSNGPWGWNDARFVEALTVYCDNGTFASGNPFIGRTDILFADSTFLLNRITVNNYAHFEQRFERSTLVGNILMAQTGGGLYKVSDSTVAANVIFKGSNTGQQNFNGTFLDSDVHCHRRVMLDLKKNPSLASGLHSPALRFLNCTGVLRSFDKHVALDAFTMMIYRRGQALLPGAERFDNLLQVVHDDPGPAGFLFIVPKETRSPDSAPWTEARWYSMTPGDASVPEEPISDWNVNALNDRSILTSTWALPSVWKEAKTGHHVNGPPYDRYGIGFVPGVYTLRLYDRNKQPIGTTVVDFLTKPKQAIYKEDLDRVPPPPPPPPPRADGVRTIDDSQSGFQVVEGQWQPGSLGRNQGNHRHEAGTGKAVARWTSTGLERGDYQVSATWVEAPNRATNTPLELRDGTTSLGFFRLNQELPPADFVDGAGVKWQHLGDPVHVCDGTLVVEITDDADGTVVADSVRLEPVE